MDLRFVLLGGSVLVCHLRKSNLCYQYVLRKGLINFLICLHSAEKDQKDIEIPVVRNFQDVFPNELLGLPSHREFDFSIKVYPWKRILILHSNSIQLPIVNTQPQHAIFLLHKQHWGFPWRCTRTNKSLTQQVLQLRFQLLQLKRGHPIGGHPIWGH